MMAPGGWAGRYGQGLAAAAFQRAHDPRMLYAAACLASKKAQGLSEGCLHAYCLALLVSCQRSL